MQCARSISQVAKLSMTQAEFIILHSSNINPELMVVIHLQKSTGEESRFREMNTAVGWLTEERKEPGVWWDICPGWEIGPCAILHLSGGQGYFPRPEGSLGHMAIGYISTIYFLGGYKESHAWNNTGEHPWVSPSCQTATVTVISNHWTTGMASPIPQTQAPGS